MPKANRYQSLHTTVIGPYGERVEIQIRTEEMNRTAEEGIAAHWQYKEGKGIAPKDSKQFAWVRQLLEWQQDLRDPREFLETVKIDLFPDEVYVFTPKGAVKQFPIGSTPVDFAYSIHTRNRPQCVGAKVNGKIVPLRYQLKNGDTVEIVTAPNHQPSKDWLKYVKTSRARTKIRQWVKAEARERSVDLGREICEREFKKYHLDFAKIIKSEEMKKIIRDFSLQIRRRPDGRGGLRKCLLPADRGQAHPPGKTRKRKEGGIPPQAPGEKDPPGAQRHSDPGHLRT